MSMYEKDNQGEFKVDAAWIDAWGADHGHPGYCRCELRKYQDGSTRVARGMPVYVWAETCSPDVGRMLSIYSTAHESLKRNAERPAK